MILDENNYKEKIHAFTQQYWQPLIELIPEIESTSKFGEWEEEDILFFTLHRITNRLSIFAHCL